MYEGRELKRKLGSGEVCVGTFVSFTDPTAAEALCGSGFDFLVIDSEHSPHDTASMQTTILACKGTPVTPIVRVAWNDQVMIKRALDIGAGGVLVPLIRTREDAEWAVAACMYPPRGIRGFGPRRPASYDRYNAEYIHTANDDIVIWLQIEHIDAVRNIEEILQTDGISGLFVGSNDLSASMGLLGQPAHEDVLNAIDTVLFAAKKAGKPVGIASSADPDKAAQWLVKGMSFITMASDQSFLVQASQHALSSLYNARGTQLTEGRN